jgi:hypothetical protein
MIEKRLHPSTLPSLVPEAALGPAGRNAKPDAWEAASVYDRA